MKVRIIKCPHKDWWYHHLVGEVVEVKDWYGKEYELIGEDFIKHCLDNTTKSSKYVLNNPRNLKNIGRILQDHCEVVQ